MTDETATTKTQHFMLAIIDAAITDHDRGVAEYDPCNTGTRLITRLNLHHHRPYPRNGDEKYARSIYTAAYWIYKTNLPDTEKK